MKRNGLRPNGNKSTEEQVGGKLCKFRRKNFILILFESGTDPNCELSL